jgi:hypothetical protein
MTFPKRNRNFLSWFVLALLAMTLRAEAEWKYEVSEDAMREIKVDYAVLRSSNSVNFDFPYNGGSTLDIVVRKKNGKLDAVMFIVSKGQFSCGFDGCEGAIRYVIDGKKGSVDTLHLANAESGKSEVLFAQHSSFVFQQLKRADSLLVELPFYQYSGIQFEFDTKGLKF